MLVRSWCPRVVPVVAAIPIASLLASSAPASSSPGGSPDAVAAEIEATEIVRMLEQGLTTDVVREWLASRSTRVSPPDPDSMIRLRQAGADDALLKLIVERSSVRTPAEPPTGVPSPAVPIAAAAADDGMARVDVTIKYRPFEPLDGDDYAPSPDLVVYVDGRALARVPAQADLGQTPFAFRTHVPPGPHVLRLAREFVDGPGSGDPARIAPETLAIEVDAGLRWELDLSWVDGAMSFGPPRPLTWALRRDGELRTGAEKIGTATDRWPELCDDIEATLDPAKKPGRSVRRRLETCVRWVDLFGGVNDVAVREAARHAAHDGDRGGFKNATPFAD